MSKPNIYFIGIGCSRSATNWIAQCLREHPELEVPFPNELHYFWKKDGLTSNYDLEGIEGYYKRFKKTDKKSGEFSPGYIYFKECPLIIHKHFPNIKIIVSFRNPIKRAFADFINLKYFEELTDAENIFDNPEILKEVVERSTYSSGLKRYLELFPRSNIKIIITDDMDSDGGRKKIIQEIYNFLEVDDTFVPPSLEKRENTSSVPKYKFLMNIRKSISNFSLFLRRNHFNFIVNFFRYLNFHKVSWYIWKKNRIVIEKPKLSEEDEIKLAEIFRRDILELEELIGRDLSSWRGVKCQI